MKVDFNVNAKDFRGREILVNGANGSPATVNLSDKIQEVLYFIGNDANADIDVKYKAYKIGVKMGAGCQDFTVDELAFIKKQVGDKVVAGIYGQICDLIDTETK